MTEEEFLITLGKLPDELTPDISKGDIRWRDYDDNEYCPITAVAKVKLEEFFYIEDYSTAVAELDLDTDLGDVIVAAADGNNPDYEQVLLKAIKGEAK